MTNRLLTPSEAALVGRRVRVLRLELGLSQRELAAGMDRVTYAYISRIENGHRIPELSALLELAAGLGTTVAYLLTGEEHGPCPLCGRRGNGRAPA